MVNQKNDTHAHYQLSNFGCLAYDRTYSTQLSPCVWIDELKRKDRRRTKHLCDKCEDNSDYHKPAQIRLSLQILQVCRQIYHETALQPFSHAIFTYESSSSSAKDRGLQAFLNALIPAQAKAITHLRLASATIDVLTSAILPKLKGLKRLELCHTTFYRTLKETIHSLEFLLSTPEGRSAARLGLQSLHIEIYLYVCALELGPHGHWEVPTLSDAMELETVLERLELKLLEDLR